VSAVFRDRRLEHFLSLAFGATFVISCKLGFILCVFIGPPGILLVFFHV
jgi:hypothetical protein